jgi:hypothetical protein
MTMRRTTGVKTRARTTARTNTTTIGPMALPTVEMKVIEAQRARVR